ncbi:MAG: DNA-processing protein DprA [Clostridia bacterium]|nr:DNA-processing protein DprA [Clostridia bacterium]
MTLTNEQKLCVFLSYLELSYKRNQEILNYFETFENLKQNYSNEKQFLDSAYQKIEENIDKFNFDNFQKYCDNKKVIVLTQDSDDYPQSLFSLSQPPLILYAKGDISLLKSKCFAIVGSRSVSFYGKDVTTKFAKGLSDCGFTIVSGLATGVDKIAHETTLESNGKTIAVLGGGFEHMYPAANIQLSEKISQNGLLVTEYFPTTIPTAYSFPARNRIIAGLSKGVLITEAGAKSGALHTRDFAIEIGVDVFAVPGNITSSKSEGTNATIKSCQGACVTCLEDILNCYGIDKKVEKIKKVQLSFDEQIIFDMLADGDKTFEYIQEKTKMSTQNLNTCLTTMQIRGIIKKLPGNSYSA